MIALKTKTKTKMIVITKISLQRSRVEGQLPPPHLQTTQTMKLYTWQTVSNAPTILQT